MKNARLVVYACELCAPLFTRAQSVFKKNGVHDAIKILRLLQETSLENGPCLLVYQTIDTLKFLRESYERSAPNRKRRVKPAVQTALFNTCRETIDALLLEAQYAVNMGSAMSNQAADMRAHLGELYKTCKYLKDETEE